MQDKHDNEFDDRGSDSFSLKDTSFAGEHSQSTDRALIAEVSRLGIRTRSQSILLYRGSELIAEYGGPYNEAVQVHCNAKGLTALLVGILVDRGKLELGQKASEFIPSRALLNNENDYEPTIEHLLSHTSGIVSPWAKSGDASLTEQQREEIVQRTALDFHMQDTYRFVENLEIEHQPGTQFSYSNEAIQLLGRIVSEAAGEPFEDFARKELFVPLGLSATRFSLDQKGNAIAALGLTSSAEDMAKIGHMIREAGSVNGKQVVSEQWIDQMGSPGINSNWGYLWRVQIGDSKGWIASGAKDDNNIYVRPKENIVLARTSYFDAKADQSGSFEKQADGLFRLLSQ